MHYSQFIIPTLEDVSKIARDNFGKVTGTTKKEDNNQVLTATDITIGQEIIKRIQKTYPQHNIIDEEAGIIDNNSSYTWTVDPLDGTSNFASGVPTYGIMIGLLENGVPVAGGVALPSFDEIYSAEKGSGAFCNGKKICVSNEIDLTQMLVAYGIDGYAQQPNKTQKECNILAGIILGIRNLRCSNSCFDVAMVAKGSYGAWLNQTQKIWDNVPEHILIVEAGGKHTDFFGNEPDYTNPLTKAGSNFTVCAAPPLLHAQLQEIIKERK